ncbi:MAG: hypothetical protein NC253_05325 [Ruminococcus sp.]|nr:hypothetical protein [Ruminococcus sp.]MCM1380338.1 hypothetical protein [Muribaculaceae bacterium]MCM1478250.1 hypothetical protein [Muribaculaceae bacterium]
MSYGDYKLHSFTYHGLNSLDFGVYIKRNGKGPYNSGARNVTVISVPGRNGDIIIDNGNYENVKITYNCRALPKPAKYASFAEQTDAIKAWLYYDVGNYLRLTDTYDPKHYRMAAFTSALEFSESEKGALDFTVTFNCKPDKYAV